MLWLSALVAKTGVGGKKQPLLLMLLLLPTGRRDTLEIEKFCRHCPDYDVYLNRAMRDGLTNVQRQCRCRIPVNNNNDDNGGNDKNDCGGTAKMLDGVGDKFEAPLERGKAEFGSLGVAVSPPLGSGLAGGGGTQNANNVAG